MIRIAICDDQEVFCEQIESKILETMEICKVEAEVDVYFSGEKFLKILENEGSSNYDLIFLDIHLNGISGITVGEEIRKNESISANKIVFISSDVSKAFESIKVEPFGFIAKPIDEEELQRVIVRFLNRYNKLKDVFTYKFNKMSYRVLTRDIVYFESNDKKILIYKSNGDIDVFYDTLDKVESQLDNSRFIRINKSYLVNSFYISVFKSDYVEISNGEELKISRNARENVSKKISEFILKGW